MSNRLQYTIAKKIILSTYFVVKAFGLWPYKPPRIAKAELEHSFYSVLYSVIAPILMLYAYAKFGSVSMYISNATFTGWTLQIVTISYSNMVIVCYILLYIRQHLQFEKTKNAYFKCVRVAHFMRQRQTKSVDVNLFIANALFKTIVLNVLNFALLLYNMSLTVADNTFLFSGIFIYLPLFVIRLYENVFYQGLLIGAALFKHLNKAIKDNVSAIRAIKSIQRKCGRNQVFHVKVLNQLNCEFEEISMIHFELIEATKSLNAIFCFHNVLWITMQIIITIILSFYQFLAIVQLVIRDGNSSEKLLNVAILVTIIMSSYEVFATSYACNSIVKEVSMSV